MLSLSSACSSTVTLPALTSHPVSCQLADSCLGVDCCVSVSDISRNLHIQLVLDPCAYTLTIQMERYRVELDLLTYNFSKLLNTTVLFIPFRTILEVYQKVLISCTSIFRHCHHIPVDGDAQNDVSYDFLSFTVFFNVFG